MITFSKGLGEKFMVQFIDTFCFMPASLTSLSHNLPSSEFHTTAKFFKEPVEFGLVTRKGVFPYDYITSMDKLFEMELPPKEAFYNRLLDSDISDTEYQHAQNVWDKFGCATLEDYSKLYLKTDVLILCDVFENFRQLCYQTYSLDCVRYVSAPGFSFDAMLKKTCVKLYLITDYDTYVFVEAGIRVGVGHCCKPHCKANNRHLAEGYDDTKPSVYLQYIDANNLYGWAMQLPLPCSEFKWANTTTTTTIDDVLVTRDNAKTGYILEVDVEYPSELHNKHQDLPFLQVNERPLPESKQHKLITNLKSKSKYNVHYVSLKQAVIHGLKVVQVHHILQFTQKAWLQPYIQLNTEMRQKASNEFEKDFFKPGQV